MTGINRLPDEVLVRIFNFYLQTETHSDFVILVSNVCKKWKRLAKDSSLFDTVDGSLPLKAIVNLATAGALKTTKTLKFGQGQVGKGNSDQYKTIYTNLPQLKSLDLSNLYCKFNKKKNYAVFTELEGLCPDLCKLVLHQPDDAPCQKPIPAAIFGHILLVRGPNFVKLDFSGAIILQLAKLFLTIANNCPNLEELLAQNFILLPKVQKFPVAQMQKGLPNLKTLRLGPPIVFISTSRDSTVGFPKLEIFSYLVEHDLYDKHLSSLALEALLYNSPNLKILDFRGCANVEFEAINSLPAVNLEQIYFSRTCILGTNISLKFFQKWSHSLNVIEMSLAGGKFVNELFLPVQLPNGLPKLQVLNVSNTAITEDTLKIIFHQCPELRYLNVQACRNLMTMSDPRRRAGDVYRSRSEIEDLLLKFDRKDKDLNFYRALCFNRENRDFLFY